VNDETMAALVAEARERGAAAGSWVIDGNTTTETARWIVTGWDDGDGAVMDLQPACLSGEWAGESLSELGLADASENELDEYETAFAEAFWGEVIRSARAVLGDELEGAE